LNIEKLIKACKRNDLKAQRQLYISYKDTLYALCLKYCRNIEEAEDNLQDSFLEIYKNIKKYKGKGSFEGWMKRITINKAITKYKKESLINIVINDNLLKDTTIDDDCLNIPLHNILNIIQELPSRYRMVFNLYELDNYSHKEIANQLNIGESTSKSNLHRAKIILKEKIQQLNLSQTKITSTHGR
jgi:RNA polymerase sigma-70 factor (ECF subfamily)